MILKESADWLSFVLEKYRESEISKYGGIWIRFLHVLYLALLQDFLLQTLGFALMKKLKKKKKCNES